MSETQLSRAIRERLALEPGVLLWRNNSGKLQDLRKRWVTFGLGVGSADLIGVVDCPAIGSSCPVPVGCARFFALEVKLPGKSPTMEQECWATAVRKIGGFATVVRSVDEAVQALARCRAGETM